MKKILIELDRERELRLDLNAMSEFEDLTGNSLFTIGEKLAEARNVRALLFVTLKAANNEMDINEIGKYVTIKNFTYVNDVIAKLLSASYGNSNEEEISKK